MAKYPANIFIDFIDRAAIDMYGKQYKIQYSLTVDNMDSNSEKAATVVLLHPVRAEQFQSDPMTNQIIRFLSKQDYQTISFVTLFPYRTATTSELRDLILDESLSDILEVNSKVIRRKLDESSIFVLAWGDRPYYVPKVKFEAAVKFIELLLNEDHARDKGSLFRYSNSPTYTVNGNPSTTSNKVIDAVISFKELTTD